MKLIRFYFLPIALIFSLSACQQQSESENDQTLNNVQFELHKGINLSHWLSQTAAWAKRDTFITENDIRMIADFGFDHVRIPIDEEVMWTVDGEMIPESFDYVKACLDWCNSHDLRAVVDLHILRSHHFNAMNGEGQITLWTDTAAQNTFISLWKDISSELKEYPTSMVGYEIMNEPMADDPDDWNQLIARAVEVIRELEPTRTLIIGSNRWQTAENFPFLEVPEDDSLIILSVHTYDPISFTHYRASWNPMRDYAGTIQYPGVPVPADELELIREAYPASYRFISDANREYNQEEFEQILMPAIEKSRELGLPLYCGEFGCLPTVPRDMRLKYYEDITSVFHKYGIAYAAWDYKGDFAIVPYDRSNFYNLQPDTALIRILTSSGEQE